MNRMRSMLLLLCLLAAGTHALAQTDTASPAPQQIVAPYLKYPTLPAFNILLLDSTTIFNTYNIPGGQPIVLLFFSPDCSHCKDEMRELLPKMDSLKDVRFYMLTSAHNMSDVRKFYDNFHLAQYKNIAAVGCDTEFFFITYYNVHSVPDMAIYDKHKKLIKLVDGHITVKHLYGLTH